METKWVKARNGRWVKYTYLTRVEVWALVIAIIIALVLRSVVRAAGPDSLERHWPGTVEGLDAVRRLIGAGAPT